jgi:hypothetical protein
MHAFRFAGAILVCQETGAPAHSEPVYIAVEEALGQVHYRAQSIGATHVDAEPRTLETGEYGFLVRDPAGNAVFVVDQRSVSWQPGARQGQPAAAVAATRAAGPASATLGMQKDFINAVKGGDLEQVQGYLGMDPALIEADDAAGVSALMHAAYKQHHAVAAYLLSHHKDPNLWEAAAFDQRERLEHLLGRGFKLNVFSADGYTPLGLACFFGHPACVKLLIDRGADVNLASDNHLKVRPLHSALARAVPEAAAVNVRALLAAGADVNAIQKGGYTALHQAADRGLSMVVKMLLAAGADRFAAADNARRPVDLARARGYTEVVALLNS